MRISFKKVKERLLIRTHVDSLDKGIYFLSSSDHEKVAYTSYSRSGNTILRKYIEAITQVATGSDADLSFNLHY